MKTNSDQWLCVDDLFDAQHLKQAFSGARHRVVVSTSSSNGMVSTPLLNAVDLVHRWRELVSAAHHSLEQCAALLGGRLPTGVQTDPLAIVCALERGCDRLASQDESKGEMALLIRVCVLSGLVGRLIRDTYDYVNIRVVMGEVLIHYQLICAKLADMVIADEIIAQRLSAAFDAPRQSRGQVSWRGIPAPDEVANAMEIIRCARTVLSLYVEILAGHAFVQRTEETPVMGVLQALLDRMLSSLSRAA